MVKLTCSFSLEFSRKVMVKACRLHQAGIWHGSLHKEDHIVAHEQGLRIVNFSNATTEHECAGSFPVLSTEIPSANLYGCKELCQLEEMFGWRHDCDW